MLENVCALVVGGDFGILTQNYVIALTEDNGLQILIDVVAPVANIFIVIQIHVQNAKKVTKKG